MGVKQCKACGAEVPVYYLSAGLCDCCKWETWIPRGYAAKEKYVYSERWRHANATRRPAMGVEFLDRKPLCLNEILPMCRSKPKSGAWIRSKDTSESRC